MKLKSLQLFLLLGMIMITGVTSAQTNYNDPAFARYGETAEEREANHKIYSYFNEEYAIKNYAGASAHIKTLLTSAPQIHQNLYIKGAMVYKNLASRAKTLDARAKYVDSLMIIHDLRIKYYGSDAKRGTHYILGEKIKDNLKYAPGNTQDIITLVDGAVTSQAAKLDIKIYPIYFKYIVDKYLADEVETELLLGEYEKLTTATDANLVSTEAKEDVKGTIESLLIQSGAASCENLEKIFKPQYIASPNDIELLSKIVSRLSRGKCTSDFQLEVAEKLYSIEPTAVAAAGIASAYEQKGDIDKAIQYYSEAVEKETDNKAKASYSLGAASVCLVGNKISDAIKFAQKTIQIDKEEGLAYFILAQAQAQGTGGCSNFNKKAAFWIVVDNLVRARNLVPENYVDQINSSISTYSSYFPTHEDVFFEEEKIEVGGRYTVSCGLVRGTTTVRIKK